MPIHILSDDLASKIAAGEVIERPASVVKELIENSIDAGATGIQVQIQGGGQRLIRVADDGSGISASDVETAFARHATSKIESAEDLFRIHTLGFRGEALPSIGAVSRVTLITRARGEESGSEIQVDGSRITEQHAQGAPAGTIVTVEDLFRHIPARLKFLKTPATEAGRISDLLNAYALAYPHLRFSLVNEGRLAFQSPGTGNLFDALVKVFGIEIAQQMLPVGNSTTAPGASEGEPDLSSPTPAIRVSGYVSPPNLNRANRKHMFFFINHRWIQDRTLQHAVIQAYHTSLMVGRAPIVVLDVSVPTDAVDVNVHPTKSEVRFRDPSAVFSAVQRAVRATLTANAPIPSIGAVGGPLRPGMPPSPGETQLAIDLHRPIPASDASRWSGPGVTAPVRPFAPPQTDPAKLPMLRVLGQIASTYIISEGPDGLYLIDQHAAHERVLYEQLLAEREGATVAVQEMLDPAPIQLTLAQSATLEANRDNLGSVGFRIEPFGPQTVLLRAVPAMLKTTDPRGVLREILEEMEQGETPLERGAEARLITSVCKSIAVKGGQVLSLEEMRELVRRLEHTTSPRTCPHGRPTVIQLNVAQLEREFGRK
jgi:DNA mismatch repair protein MutL